VNYGLGAKRLCRNGTDLWRTFSNADPSMSDSRQSGDILECLDVAFCPVGARFAIVQEHRITDALTREDHLWNESSPQLLPPIW
jgi:hypothetical protein